MGGVRDVVGVHVAQDIRAVRMVLSSFYLAAVLRTFHPMSLHRVNTASTRETATLHKATINHTAT